MSTHFHYIITGAGLAGSSLLMRMMREPFFAKKRILIIDQTPKTVNDRTWCFWEKEAGMFEPVVHHRWNRISFYSDTFSDTMDISPYQYKMIRGIDLYEYVSNESRKHHNIEWRYAKIRTIKNRGEVVIVETEAISYTADYVFNSIMFHGFPQQLPGGGKGYFFLQHFKGWMIETNEPHFDPAKATFMDFRVRQKYGTAFMYMLPTSPTAALVEYTLFTKELLQQEAYDIALRKYISSLLQLTDYKVTHEEFGVIPMTNMVFPLQKERIIYIGIAGGQVKGSSGYAFQFIQKRSKQIVDALIKDDEHLSLHHTLSEKKFRLYDSILLNVLENRKMDGAGIFSNIFQKNPPQRVLRFLDNESSLQEDLQIMHSVPTRVFLPAALREIWR